MATLQQLRASAKALGLSAQTIRSATSADELSALIVQHMNGDAPTKTKRTPAKKTVTRKPVTRKPPAVKSKPAVKSTPGKAKRSTTDNGDSGRHLLGKVNYSVTEGWNPRPGSPPDLIIKSLRKFKGDREKVFQALKADVKKFVKPKMNDGTTRSKDSREEMLKYRISRTAWDFAMKTDQHEKSENRAEYGSLTSKPTRRTAPARKPATARKPVAKKPVAKTTRPAKKKRRVRR